MHAMFEEIDGFLSAKFPSVGEYDQKIKRAA
jgi:hypothetical protein